MGNSGKYIAKNAKTCTVVLWISGNRKSLSFNHYLCCNTPLCNITVLEQKYISMRISLSIVVPKAAEMSRRCRLNVD